MTVERVQMQLTANRMARHRAATHRTEAENKPTAAADIPAAPTTNDRSLQRQTADEAILGGAYQLRRFAFWRRDEAAGALRMIASVQSVLRLRLSRT